MKTPLLITSFICGGIVNPYRLVKAGASAGLALQAAGATVPMLGVAELPGGLLATALGDPMDVITHGFGEVEFGAAVAYGDPVTSDADGKAIKAEFAAGQAVHVAGYAMCDGVAGDIGSLLISPAVIYNRSVEIIVEKTLTGAQVAALFAAPISIIAAPGAGKAYVPSGPAVAFMDFATAAYDGVAGNEDLTLKYTDANGTILYQFETTGFLDQGNDQVRVANPTVPVAGTNLTPVANAAIVAHITTAEIFAAAGDSPVKLRVPLRLIDTAW